MARSICRGYTGPDKFEYVYHTDGCTLWAYSREDVFVEYDFEKKKFNLYGKANNVIPKNLNLTHWPSQHKQPGPGLSTVLFIPNEHVLLTLPRYHFLRLARNPFHIFKEFSQLLKQLGF